MNLHYFVVFVWSLVSKPDFTFLLVCKKLAIVFCVVEVITQEQASKLEDRNKAKRKPERKSIYMYFDQSLIAQVGSSVGN